MKKKKAPNQQTELERILDKHAEQISEEIKNLKIYYTAVEIQTGGAAIKLEVDKY